MTLGAQRQTLRKRLITETLNGYFGHKPVLLEELRWSVLREEAKRKGKCLDQVSDSSLKSFARTIREHCPDLRSVRIPINDAFPVGLLARAGVYRLRVMAEQDSFLTSAEATVLCRFTKKLPAWEPRYVRRYVTPQHHAVTLRFFAAFPCDASFYVIEGAPGVFIPATQRLSLVCSSGVTVALETELKRLSTVPWRLVGYDRGCWFDVSAMDGLNRVST